MEGEKLMESIKSMEWKKMFEAAKLPIVALVVLGILGYFLGWLSLILLPVGLVITAYAGYAAVKQFKLDLIFAGLTGTIVSVVSGIVNSIISLVILVSMAPAGGGMVGAAAATSFVMVFIMGALISLVIGAVIGFIMGAIGGFVAQKF